MTTKSVSVAHIVALKVTVTQVTKYTDGVNVTELTALQHTNAALNSVPCYVSSCQVTVTVMDSLSHPSRTCCYLSVSTTLRNYTAMAWVGVTYKRDNMVHA